MQGFDANGRCTIHCPWKGATIEQVEKWAQQGYRMTAEQWAMNYDRMAREDAEDTRAMLYPTAIERILND